jgi:phage baseplate assembly protein gpV
MSADTISVESIVKNLKKSVELGENDDGKEGDRKFYGVVVGRVINPLDPQGLGRVQVQLPFIDSLDLSPWARVAGPMAGIFHGTYIIPNLGDEVLVAFEHGDVNAPYIIGSLWNTIQRPPLPSPVPQIRAIRTLVGNQIVFTEAPPSVTIQTGPTSPVPMPTPASPAGPHQTLMMSPLGIALMGQPMIVLQVGTSTVTVNTAGILLQAGGSSISITPAGIFLNAANISINGAGNVGIFGGMVRINS